MQLGLKNKLEGRTDRCCSCVHVLFFLKVNCCCLFLNPHAEGQSPWPPEIYVLKERSICFFCPNTNSLWEVSVWSSFGPVSTTAQLRYSLTEQVMLHIYNPVTDPQKMGSRKRWKVGRNIPNKALDLRVQADPMPDLYPWAKLHPNSCLDIWAGPSSLPVWPCPTTPH